MEKLLAGGRGSSRQSRKRDSMSIGADHYCQGLAEGNDLKGLSVFLHVECL